jgi:hypothetical protein
VISSLKFRVFAHHFTKEGIDNDCEEDLLHKFRTENKDNLITETQRSNSGGAIYKIEVPTARCSHLASKSHVTLAVTVLISVTRSVAESALVASIVVLPRLATVLEHHRVVVTTLGLDLNSVGQVAGDAQSLGLRVDGSALNRSNDLLLRVVDDDIECVFTADSVLVALVLYDVHGTPAFREAWGRVHRLEDAETKGSGADLGDTALPCLSLSSGDFGLAT